MKIVRIFVVVLLFSCSFCGVGRAADFDVMVVPSLIDKGLDAWYKTPPETVPVLPSAAKVYRNQVFNVLVFFHGYALDKDGDADLTFDLQVYDPMGNPTDDTLKGVTGFKGKGEKSADILLDQSLVRITFTDKYKFGDYVITVTAHDQVSGKTVQKSARVLLEKFTIPEKFESEKKFSAWVMRYHVAPDPAKAVAGMLQFVKTDERWVNKHLSLLEFLRTVFDKNPFLWKELSAMQKKLSPEDQEKVLLVYALDRGGAPLFRKMSPDLRKFYTQAQNYSIPNADKVVSGVQLDVLWAQFLAAGRIEPIEKIVNTLSLSRYAGALQKMRSEKDKNPSEELKMKAILESVYQAAGWSLYSNCLQIPLVYKYCVYIYQNEELEYNVKEDLAQILKAVSDEMKKMADQGKQPGTKTASVPGTPDKQKQQKTGIKAMH